MAKIVYSTPPIGGLKKDLPANLLKRYYSPRLSGVWSVDGKMCRIPGKQKYSGTRMSGGPVKRLYEFIMETGDRYLLAVTPEKVYRYNSITEAFESIQDAGDFTVTENDAFALETFLDGTANEIAVIANGTDAPRKWDGNTATIETLGGSPPGAVTLCVFANHLLFGHTTEGGTTYPRRVRYSAMANGENYPAENYFDLRKDTFPVVSIRRISRQAAIYKAGSISLISYLGGSQTFDLDENYIGDKGPINDACIVTYGDGLEAHYFIGTDLKAYRFDGIECQIVSESIQSVLQNINPTHKVNISGTVIREENKIIWAVPYDTDEACRDLIIFDTKDRTWWVKESEPVGISSWGSAKLETTYTWDTLPFDSWDEWDDPGGWNSRHLLANAPEFLIGCADGYVRKFVGGVDDDGAPLVSRYMYPFDNADGNDDHFKILTRIVLEVENRGGGTITIRVYTNNNDNDPVVLDDTGNRSMNIKLLASDNDQRFIQVAVDIFVYCFNFAIELYSAGVAWSGRVQRVEYEQAGEIPKNIDQTGDTWHGDQTTWSGEEAIW